MGENVYHLYNRVPHLVDACYRSEGWCHSSSCSDQQPRGLPGFLLPSSQHPSSGKCRPRLCLPPALCPFVPFRSLCRASLLPFLPPSDSAQELGRLKSMGLQRVSTTEHTHTHTHTHTGNGDGQGSLVCYSPWLGAP